MQYDIYFVVIFALCGIIFGQVTQPGRCPNVPTVQSFDLQMFLGPWFVVEQFPEFRQIDEVCPVTVFNLNINYTIRVEKTNFDTIDGRYVRSDATAVIANPIDPGKWIIQDPSQQYPYPFWIIDTDYRTFAVTWTCVDLFNGSHLQTLQIFSRFRQGLPQYIRFLIYRYLIAFGIDIRYFQSSDQTTCLMQAQQQSSFENTQTSTPLIAPIGSQRTRSF